MTKSAHFLHHFIGIERIQQFIILSVESVYVLIVELAVGTDVFLQKGGMNVFVFLMYFLFELSVSLKIPLSSIPPCVTALFCTVQEEHISFTRAQDSISNYKMSLTIQPFEKAVNRDITFLATKSRSPQCEQQISTMNTARLFSYGNAIDFLFCHQSLDVDYSKSLFYTQLILRNPLDNNWAEDILKLMHLMKFLLNQLKNRTEQIVCGKHVKF